MSIGSATTANLQMVTYPRGVNTWSGPCLTKICKAAGFTRLDLPRFLLFPPLPQNKRRTSIWAYTELQFPCISHTKCTSNSKCKLLLVYSCCDRCHQLAQLHVILKVVFFFPFLPSRWAGFQPWKGKLCCLVWVRQVHQVRRRLRWSTALTSLVKALRQNLLPEPLLRLAGPHSLLLCTLGSTYILCRSLSPRRGLE